jgi:hypothetical protein
VLAKCTAHQRDKSLQNGIKQKQFVAAQHAQNGTCMPSRWLIVRLESLLIIKRQDRPIRAENYADFFGIITLLQKKA